MSIHFPVMARVRSDEHDIPKPKKPTLTIGVFDNYGYWASIGEGALEFPEESLDLATRVANMMNAAYEQGKEDAQAAVRQAIGL